MVYKICLYFLFFIFYSVCGWSIEMVYCVITDSINNKKLTINNRGFLIGPLCPIYGFTATAMLIVLSGFNNNIFYLFFIGILACDFVEYITSYLMEKLFNARWWDYKDDFLNLNGRISFKHSVMWGFLSVLFIKVIHPLVENKIFSVFSKEAIKYIAIAALFLFLYDIINTMITAQYIRGIHAKMKQVRIAISSYTSENAVNRSDVPSYAKELHERFQNAQKSRYAKNMRRFLKQYPRLVELMQNEFYEIQSIPHEFAEDLKDISYDLEEFFDKHRDDHEMH